MIEIMFKDNFTVPRYVIQTFSLYEVYIVSAREEFRPDLIAEKYYGDTTFTAPILKLNGLSPSQILAGLSIKLPYRSVVGTVYE